MLTHSKKTQRSINNQFNLSNRNIGDNSLSKNNNSFVPIQAQLTVNSPNDIYEKEAEEIADKVMRTPLPEPINFSASKNSINRKCSECEEKEKGLQRKESNNETISVATKCSRINKVIM